MEFALGQITGLLLALAAIVAVMSVVGAITLGFASEISTQFRPSFWESYKISLLASGIAGVICFAIGFVVGLIGKDFNIWGYVLLVAIGFLSNAVIIASMLKHPEKGYVSLGRACWITVLQLFLALAAIGGLVQLFRLITT